LPAPGAQLKLPQGISVLLHRASPADFSRQLKSAGFVRVVRQSLARRKIITALGAQPTGDVRVRPGDARERLGAQRRRRAWLTAWLACLT
jgi:hypothetical protein